MTSSLWQPRHYFLVHRVVASTRACDLVDMDPVGGVTVRGWDKVQVIGAAYDLALQRFPCHDGEFICIVEVGDTPRRRAVLRMEEEWLCEMAELEDWWVLT